MKADIMGNSRIHANRKVAKMPHALRPTPGSHAYFIKLEHGYECETEEIEFEAVGPEVALKHLSAIPNKRRAIMFEDGKKIADLTFLEGF